ncbi:MFS transporter [Streptomyces sp. H27-C3]|uniref:MFS transporter n=1 Tax=Streptomyces sp. H27-C3 TaxID=3046305 RepID=UPI0024BB9AC6|nr:MFS transporter [Streptomyces sp. H27-C3]MDJ0466731.1 hypothetical protein [Streptomyces sp. H27-C3]
MSADSAASKVNTAPDSAEAVPGDLRMARVLWPVMLASAVGLLPFTVFNTHLVPIADAADTGVAAMGQLRGLGGLAALAVGTALAPFIDRVRKEWAAAGGLALLAVSALLGATGEFLFLAAFCLLVGAGTAVLNPALTAAAADRFGNRAAAGRAATLVTATQSFTALMAAPLVALPALLWGWQGNLLAVSVAAVLLLRGVLRQGRALAPGAGARHTSPGLRRVVQGAGGRAGRGPAAVRRSAADSRVHGVPRLPRGVLRRALRAVPGAVRAGVDTERHGLLPG